MNAAIFFCTIIVLYRRAWRRRQRREHIGGLRPTILGRMFVK